MTERGTGPEPGRHELLERAGHYRLLAELFAQEPDAEVLELAAEVPALRRHASRPAAAQYTHVFVLNVYPFASVFLEPDGAIDGPRAGFTRDVLATLGLSVETGMAADHIAVLLDAVAALVQREAAATATPGPDSADAIGGAAALAAQRARHAQRTVLLEHILPWAPLFLDAVGRVDRGLFAAAARLTRTVLTEHATSLLIDMRDPPTTPGVAPTDLSAPTMEAGERKARPSPMAWLAAPAHCGMFLSRADLARLAAELDLAVRFGGRPFMLESLAHAAAQLGAERELSGALVAFARGRSAELRAWCDDLPRLSALWLPWSEHIDVTLQRLGNGPGADAGSGTTSTATQHPPMAGPA